MGERIRKFSGEKSFRIFPINTLAHINNKWKTPLEIARDLLGYKLHTNIVLVYFNFKNAI